MLIERRIERHQLPYFLQVFNRYTDKPLGCLGNASQHGLMLISDLPILVDADFQLQLKIPGLDGEQITLDINACCRWCHEDETPGSYDSGFVLEASPIEYAQLIRALQHYFSFHSLEASV